MIWSLLNFVESIFGIGILVGFAEHESKTLSRYIREKHQIFKKGTRLKYKYLLAAREIKRLGSIVSSPFFEYLLGKIVFTHAPLWS